jgi:hypothetical protein
MSNWKWKWKLEMEGGKKKKEENLESDRESGKMRSEVESGV